MPPRRPKPKDTPAKLASRMKRRWHIVLIRSKGEVLGTVEAADPQAAEGGQDDVGRKRHQFRCVFAGMLCIECLPTNLDLYVVAIGPAPLHQSLLERRDARL